MLIDSEEDKILLREIMNGDFRVRVVEIKAIDDAKETKIEYHIICFF